VQQACSQQSFMAATSSSFQHLSYLLKYRLWFFLISYSKSFSTSLLVSSSLPVSFSLPVSSSLPVSFSLQVSFSLLVSFTQHLMGSYYCCYWQLAPTYGFLVGRMIGNLAPSKSTCLKIDSPDLFGRKCCLPARLNVIN
jgi:hypothetical protein